MTTKAYQKKHIRDWKQEELITELKILHHAINVTFNFGLWELVNFGAIQKELGRRGYEVVEGKDGVSIQTNMKESA